MHAKLLARQRLYSQDSARDSVVCMIRGAGMDATTMQRMGGDSGVSRRLVSSPLYSSGIQCMITRMITAMHAFFADVVDGSAEGQGERASVSPACTSGHIWLTVARQNCSC